MSYKTTIFTPPNKLSAFVIILGSGRFFYAFGKKNRVLTAHCLAGAKFFHYEEDTLLVIEKLNALQRLYQVNKISSFDNFLYEVVSKSGIDTDIDTFIDHHEAKTEPKKKEILLPSTLLDGLWVDNKLVSQVSINEDLPF